MRPVALLLLTGCQDPASCDGDFPLPCYTVDGGRYLVLEPEAAEGPLPLFVHFHGYNGSAAKQARKASLTTPLQERGVLGIFPDGVDGSWGHVGSPSQDRDELAYLDAVLADVARRYDLDPTRRWVSGHSQGGSMAWDAACYRGEAFTGLMPNAGAFWEPLPETCPSGPITLRHTHGTNDRTVPLEGRAIGGQWRQGDVSEGLDIWRAVNGCAEQPDRVVEEGPSTCQVWDASCASGDEIWLCLHDGEHAAPAGWAGRVLDWAEASAR